MHIQIKKVLKKKGGGVSGQVYSSSVLVSVQMLKQMATQNACMICLCIQSQFTAADIETVRFKACEGICTHAWIVDKSHHR